MTKEERATEDIEECRHRIKMREKSGHNSNYCKVITKDGEILNMTKTKF
jgi:hypothetical protein